MLIPLVHCEGPDHLERMVIVVERTRQLAGEAPDALRLNYLFNLDQALVGRDVIARFGRHPHRNALLGRRSTDAEAAYIAAGVFPHNRPLPQTLEAANDYLRQRGLL